MAFKSITVSQLRLACLDSEWRAKWLHGENPSTASFSPPGTPTVYGREFHQLTRKFVDWLIDSLSIQEANRLKDEHQIFVALNRLGAEQVLNEILENGQIDSAAALTDALHNFALNLRHLRERHLEFNSWRDIFIAQEFPIQDIRLTIENHSLFVSGVIDCLRMHPNRHLEVVDYKLTQGNELNKELVQIALYRELLRKAHPSFEFSGVLEYFLPKLHVQEFSSDDLDDTFHDLINPVLCELLGTTPIKTQQITSLEDSPIIIGNSRDLFRENVTVDTTELTRHCAFLGGSGSGKTTLALNLIEQVLVSGIPVILVDRKGDLCRYAKPSAWHETLDDAEMALKRERLQRSIDIVLYTPGHSSGRPIAISVAPLGLADLEPSEQEQTAKIASSALASMMNFKSSASDQAKLAILTKAILVLSQVRPQEIISLDALLDFINSQNEMLVKAMGFLGINHIKKLVENLQTLQIMNGDLLAPYPESLNAEALFGHGSWKRDGKTRLTIISTKFLGDQDSVLFWVSQLLVELGRFASRNPSGDLQGIVLFDEADMYLPAVSKPPTKEPMENLLRRARSAGLGIMLATQSPGDFDYKCKENIRTWFVGLVKEKTALEKMSPMLSEATIDVSGKLASQKVGQFYVLREGQVQSLQASRSIIRTEQLPEAEILDLARINKDKSY